MAGALNKIYYDFTKGFIDTREVLYRLSLLDMMCGDDEEDFKRNLRLKRTIVTELVRHGKLSDDEKASNLGILAKKYLREYLYWIISVRHEAVNFGFTDYVRRTVKTHALPRDQYNKIDCRDEFWNAVKELERAIAVNSNLM